MNFLLICGNRQKKVVRERRREWQSFARLVHFIQEVNKMLPVTGKVK